MDYVSSETTQKSFLLSVDVVDSFYKIKGVDDDTLHNTCRSTTKTDTEQASA